ncbi:MAG: hypothetical protein ACYC61_07395 [Isosphaeraceae bacterium]
MMRKPARTSRVGCVILAAAMSIQALTPDPCNLASTWLLRHVATEVGTIVPADGHGSVGQRICLGADDCVPGLLRTAPDGDAALDSRGATGGRSFQPVLAVIGHSKADSCLLLHFHPSCLATHQGAWPLPALCRFRC